MAQRKPVEDLIFSLDIGTRTVVGIVGKMVDDLYHVVDHEVIPHAKRSMMDGQIEDIEEVAKVVEKVKQTLEKRNNTKFSDVAIAAAGRSLKTERVVIEIDIPTEEPISEHLAESFEMEAISNAQHRIDALQAEIGSIAYYCVGYSIIGYKLDGYAMKSIKGHRGKKIEVEVIAAFLPSMVVESLYTVMEKNKLEVTSLTLEPIAAMNVIVPPEVRLINIALVDIGAGTSDIAISQNGSIVAYAMATTAGDEITEEIIKHYLVDFATAEEMKTAAVEGKINYKDILGFEYSITAEEFYETIQPSVEALANAITSTIVDINGSAPSAIFLVGGGSLLPSLPSMISEKLAMPQARIAVSGSNYIKSVVVSKEELASPEFVTPIGIGVTSIIDKGYDFSNVFLNDKKFKVFDTKNLKVFDVLLMGGYKAKEILGRSGSDLMFHLNGKEIIKRGESGTPAELTLNGEPTTLNSFVKKWDKIGITPAINGNTPTVKVYELLDQSDTLMVRLNDLEYTFEPHVLVNGEEVSSGYEINYGDQIQISSVTTLSDLIKKSGLSSVTENFYKEGNLLALSYHLKDRDIIATTKKQEAEFEKQEISIDFTKGINIVLNGESIFLPEKDDNSPHLVLEVLNFIPLDASKRVAVSDMRINGKAAEFISEMKENDRVDILFTE